MRLKINSIRQASEIHVFSTTTKWLQTTVFCLFFLRVLLTVFLAMYVQWRFVLSAWSFSLIIITTVAILDT